MTSITTKKYKNATIRIPAIRYSMSFEKSVNSEYSVFSPSGWAIAAVTLT